MIDPDLPSVSILVPAWNEADRIVDTLRTIRSQEVCYQREIIVIDDGSTDGTAEAGEPYCDKMIVHPANSGKGQAIISGLAEAGGEILVLLDADLGGTASCYEVLLRPVLEGDADMSIARFGKAERKGGFGLVKGLARRGIFRMCGFLPEAPLSGQRALRKEVLQRISISHGFGVEVGLTIDAARAGYRIVEVDVPFRHRETGRDLQGFIHRGKQFAAVFRTLCLKWREHA